MRPPHRAAARPSDPPEFYHYYAAPVGAMVGGYAIGNALGFTQMGPVMETAAGLLCIGGIAGLATQKTARLGNTSGIAGITLGLAATLGSASPSARSLASLRLRCPRAAPSLPLSSGAIVSRRIARIRPSPAHTASAN